jgi:hypothetical protein
VPVRGATEATQPSGNQLYVLVAVQRGIECDVVSAGIEVTKGQAREWLEPSSAQGLLNIEIEFPAVYLIPDRVQRQTRFIFVISRARTHHTPPRKRNGVRLEKVELDQDRMGARTTRLLATVDASRTSHGVHDRRSGVGGIRHARLAMSGSAPGKPMPFDTRLMTSQEFIGRPSSGGAIRSRMPSARTPFG